MREWDTTSEPSHRTLSTIEALDNPIWAALTTEHRPFAIVNGLARRYPSAMARFAALAEPTAAAFSDLRALVTSGELVGLFTAEPLDVPEEWAVQRTRSIEQMVCTRFVAPSAAATALVTLREADVPEMLALAASTQPGPFFRETIRMGRYLGVRADDGRLAAMAGERLRMTGITEISAVCTDPAFQGRGLGRALVAALCGQSLAESRLPCLHVKSENGAKRLYERLGFKVRREIQLTLVAAR